MLNTTEAFASLDDYVVHGGQLIPPTMLPKELLKASDDVNTLTFGRARAQWDSLTPFQQAVIKRVTCLQADFKNENKELLDSILNSYSINGVSMGFNGSNWNVYVQSGVAMPHAVYGLLRQTGLTSRTF